MIIKDMYLGDDAEIIDEKKRSEREKKSHQ